MGTFLFDFFNNFLCDLLLEILKKGVKWTAEELSRETNYPYNSCKEIVSKINPDMIENKDDLLSQLNKTHVVDSLRNDYYKTNFSIRLDYIIRKIRECIPEANIEWLSYKMGLKSSNELLKYYRVPEEPTFDFIDDIANKIGVKSNWLQFGEDDRNFETVHWNINTELLNYIKSNNICSIYFAFSKAHLSENENSQLIMIFKYNELKYVVNTKTIPFGSYVGGGGQRKICEFYVFLLWLKREGILDFCESFSITETQYNNLVFGRNYGKSVEKHGNSLQNLVWDFSESEYPLLSDEQILYSYRKSLLECRDIILNNTNIVNDLKKSILIDDNERLFY